MSATDPAITALPDDPMADGGIAAYGERLRRGETSAVAATEAYLARIDRLEPKLGAFEHVAAEAALVTARGIDVLLSIGVDLGPLMGVPVVLKDLFAIDGMPVTAGSNVDVTDLVGPEGSFVKRLRRSGCILLGKSRTVEFARGASGISRLRGTPWNPWDATTHRIPGGSSSGSAVAVAAGLCGFAIGTDTGGSVRGPAAFCGVFGHKTTHGLWAIDGVYPNAPSFDTIGPITRTARDAAVVFGALTGQAVPAPPSPGRLRLGKPANHFFDDLEPEVEHCIAAAIAALKAAGAEIVPVDVPEAGERGAFVQTLCTVELIANLGRERFLAVRDQLDPLTASRAEPGLAVPATAYVRMLQRHRELRRIYAGRMADFDAWITPTATLVAPAVAPAMKTLDDTMAVEARLGVNTHLVSYFGLCATTSPIQSLGARLPVGLQTICPGGADARALSIAIAFETLFGPPPRPDLSRFS